MYCQTHRGAMQYVLRLLLITRLVGVGIFKPGKNLLSIMDPNQRRVF